MLWWAARTASPSYDPEHAGGMSPVNVHAVPIMRIFWNRLGCPQAIDCNAHIDFGPQWGEDGSLVDVRIGIGDSASVELNGEGDPSQHRQKRAQPFDGVELAADRPSTEQESAEAEPHTPPVRFGTQTSCGPSAYMLATSEVIYDPCAEANHVAWSSEEVEHMLMRNWS